MEQTTRAAPNRKWLEKFNSLVESHFATLFDDGWMALELAWSDLFAEVYFENYPDNIERGVVFMCRMILDRFDRLRLADSQKALEDVSSGRMSERDFLEKFSSDQNKG